MKTQGNESTVASKSQLNHSTAKACYSFSRAPRSPKEGHINDALYDLPTMMSSRATSIGFGNKTSLIPKVIGPSPDKYDKKSDFDSSPKKGISFGTGRENTKAVSIFINTKYPGPGQYDSAMRETVKSYAMRGRDGFPSLFQSTHSPGPGKYDIHQEIQKNFYADSTKKCPPSYTIKKGKENDHIDPKVGPGTYQTSFASMGRQILGNKKTEKSFCFDKQARQTIQISKNVAGPGSYERFSEFGN